MGVLIVFAVYGLIGLAILGVAVLVYARATLSRKTYHCPECNERISVELMDARHCNVCGAALRERNQSLDYYD